jgi:hypothetical protein
VSLVKIGSMKVTHFTQLRQLIYIPIYLTSFTICVTFGTRDRYIMECNIFHYVKIGAGKAVFLLGRK